MARTRSPLLLCWLWIACGGERDLSTDQLAQVVAAQQPTLKRCYDAALERTPSKDELRLEAEIHVAPSGRVSSAVIPESKGEPTLPGLSSCLRQAISGWVFPRADAETHTSLPIVLKPEIKPSGPSLDDVQKVLRDIRKKEEKPKPGSPSQPKPQPASPPQQ